MDRITSGRILVFHLFELAEEVRLDLLRQIWADSSVGQLIGRKPLSSAIQFRDPPVLLPLGARPLTSRLAGAVRAKIFDFGVASIAWEIQAPGLWSDLIDRCAELQEDLALEAASRRVFEEVRMRIGPACLSPIPESKLVEDYFVVHIEDFDLPVSSDEILDRHSIDLALILRGERRDLSAGERKDALRLRHSYRPDDLVVVTYESAFVYDRDGTTDHIDIIEFANAQLLDLRYYDALMDRELEDIYDKLQRRAPGIQARGKLLETSRLLNRLMIEVYGLRENTRNSLKVVGEMYSARVYRMIADTLRLERWDQAIGEKLQMSQEVYKVLLEELNQRRFMILEIVIILLILLEVVLFIFQTPLSGRH